MKKYAVLLISTAAAAALLVGIGNWRKPSPVVVSLVTLTPQTVRQTVECSGKVESASRTEVFSPTACIAGEVFVKAGQRVEKGDPLFKVDTEATKAVLAGFGTPVTDGSLAQEVVAPVSGVISAINVSQGGAVDPSAACAVIQNGEGIQIAAVVREKYLQQVAVGQSVEITGVDFSKPVYHGVVAAIADTAHQQYIGSTPETVVAAVVEVEPTEIDPSLRVGLNAKAIIVVGTLENALLIPYSCIGQTDEGEEYVYLYSDDGVARRQPITVSAEFPDGALVVSGIPSTAKLVQDPHALQGETVVCREG